MANTTGSESSEAKHDFPHGNMHFFPVNECVGQKLAFTHQHDHHEWWQQHVQRHAVNSLGTVSIQRVTKKAHQHRQKVREVTPDAEQEGEQTEKLGNRLRSQE